MTSSKYKPTVRYNIAGEGLIAVGYRATIIPLNHTSSLVENGNIAHTSKVTSYDPVTGDFETANTKYVLNK